MKPKSIIMVALLAVCLLPIPAAIRAQDATATAAPIIAPDEICANTGHIFREYWNDIPGFAIGNLTGDPAYPASPSGAGTLIVFEGMYGFNDYENYGERYRGYLCPSADGRYTFWIAGDDVAELYLSTDIDPANKSRIASVAGAVAYQDWDNTPSQKSTPITLKAGQPYYIEVLHKQGTGGYNLSVAWEGPGIERQVIDGTYLSAAGFTAEDGVVSDALCAESGGILREYWSDISVQSIQNFKDNPAYPDSPNRSGMLLLFEGPYGFKDNDHFGERYRGYLCPPADGDYTFWIAADDIAELYLSTDKNPINRTRIASVSTDTGYQEWTVSPSQKSVAIRLKGGQAYYIEVLHTQGTGGYNLSVAWEGAGLERQIISGEYIVPFVVESVAPAPTPTASS